MSDKDYISGKYLGMGEDGRINPKFLLGKTIYNFWPEGDDIVIILDWTDKDGERESIRVKVLTKDYNTIVEYPYGKFVPFKKPE